MKGIQEKIKTAYLKSIRNDRLLIRAVMKDSVVPLEESLKKRKLKLMIQS